MILPMMVGISPECKRGESIASETERQQTYLYLFVTYGVYPDDFRLNVQFVFCRNASYIRPQASGPVQYPMGIWSSVRNRRLAISIQ